VNNTHPFWIEPSVAVGDVFGPISFQISPTLYTRSFQTTLLPLFGLFI